MARVNFAGLDLKNPTIVASATPAISVETIKRAAAAGAGAVVTKSVIFGEKDGKPAGGYSKPRFQLMNCSAGYDPKLTEKGGLFTFFRFAETYPTPEKMAKMLEELKGPNGVDIPIIVSICAPVNDYKAWQELAILMQDAGADALELNMHAWPVIKYTNPMIVKAVKDVAKVPVICKLMAANDDPELAGQQVEVAGADAITGLGTFGFKAMEIDIENQRPWMGTAHGIGGSWLRSVSLAYMANVAKKTTVPLSGVTGVQTWQDAVKYMLIGCSTVQVCGAIYARGYKVLTEISDGIDQYMKQHGYKSIDDFKGNALKNMATPEYNPPIRAMIDEEKCINCKQCVELCLFDAISVNKGQVEISEKCDGCGVCWSYCPQKAISMERYK